MLDAFIVAILNLVRALAIEHSKSTFPINPRRTGTDGVEEERHSQ